MRRDLAEYFSDLARYRMPFGRFKGSAIHDLPLEYLRWFPERAGGFPKSRLGELMEFVCQVKSDGAEMIFAPLRQGEGRDSQDEKRTRNGNPFSP